MDPITLTLIGVGLGVASGGAKVFGAYQQKRGMDMAGDVAEQEAEAQAATLRRAAEAERIRRMTEELNERGLLKRRRATQEATYAKSGVTTQGSPAAVMAEQRVTDEINVLRGNQESAYQQRLLRRRADNALRQGRNIATSYENRGRALMTSAILGGIMDIGKSAAGAAGNIGGMAGGMSGLLGGGAGASAPTGGGGGLGSGGSLSSMR